MLNYSWLTCWIRGERPEQKSASTEMKEIVKSSRNPRTSKYQALIVRCLESWFCQEKQNRLFSVDWVLRQKHPMTTTKRSGKVVSHYTSSAIHWPIILQIEVWNLWSDLHPKKWHIIVFKLLSTWCYWFLLAASFIILTKTVFRDYTAFTFLLISFPSFKTANKYDIISHLCFLTPL